MNRNRRPKANIEIPAVVRRADDMITQTRRYKVITPLFGGGVGPAQADPITVVRGTEVRGQLRFWWRATRGGQFNGELQEMKRREESIWGTAAAKGEESGQSEVGVIVRKVPGSEPKLDPPFEVVRSQQGRPQVRPRRGSSAHPYVSFPLQPEQRSAQVGMTTKAVSVGVEFILVISYKKQHQEDVDAALWAWETFGGIGARTRRGFGALHCVEIDEIPLSAPYSSRITTVIEEGLKTHVTGGVWPHGVPHLARNMRMKIKRRRNNPLEAWRELIDALQKFRQVPEGRRPGTPFPGRSYWPEPEVIRKITGFRHPKHQPLGAVIEKFPRAQFGLPIIFHFKDSRQVDRGDPKSRDPVDTTLRGIRTERLASPLILRPLACSDGAVGMAAILNWEVQGADSGPFAPPGGLMLENAPGNPQVHSGLTAGEALDVRPLNGQPDVLQAFLDYL